MAINCIKTRIYIMTILTYPFKSLPCSQTPLHDTCTDPECSNQKLIGIPWWDGQQCCVASQTVAPVLDNDLLCDSQWSVVIVTLHLSGGLKSSCVTEWTQRANSVWRLIWLMCSVLHLNAWNNSDAIKPEWSPYIAVRVNGEGQLSMKQLIHHV